MRNRTWGDRKTEAFEAWKYHSDIGGHDKDWMIQIVTWLLGFSSAILVYSLSGSLEPQQRMYLAILGSIISVVGVFVTFLYGGYAARNWSIAARIAENHGLTEQKSTYCPYKDTVTRWSVTNLWRCLSGPCDSKIAPVFWFYILVSLVFLVVHIFVWQSFGTSAEVHQSLS